MDATQKGNNIPEKPNRMALICCLHRCVKKDTSGFDTGTQKWAGKRMKTMWRAIANQAITRSRSRWLGPIVSGWLSSLGFLSLAAVVTWMSVWTGVIKSGSSVWGIGGRESGSVFEQFKKARPSQCPAVAKQKCTCLYFFFWQLHLGMWSIKVHEAVPGSEVLRQWAPREPT